MKTTGLTAQGQQMLTDMDNRLPEEGQRGTDQTTDFKNCFLVYRPFNTCHHITCGLTHTQHIMFPRSRKVSVLTSVSSNLIHDTNIIDNISRAHYINQYHNTTIPKSMCFAFLVSGHKKMENCF